MPIDLKIINGKVFTKEGFKEGGVAIEGNRIVKIGKEPSLPSANEILKVNDALILPGLIDIHVHTRDFNQKYKETLETGTRSAVSGGITSILDMPNNDPPINSLERINNKKKLIHEKAASNIGFYSLIPDKNEEIRKLTKEGIFGFKIYPSSEIYPPKNNELLKIKLKQIAEMKIPLIIHPDSAFAGDIEKELIAKTNDPIDAFLRAHNQEYEAQALKDFIHLNTDINCFLHCAHVTAKETISVLEANKNNLLLSSEVCAHHLMLIESNLRKFKSVAKCLPPIRTKTDQIALWNALRNNVIDIIATDHAPHSYNEKHQEFEAAASGMPGLETLVPLMFTSALKGKISLNKLILNITENPARKMKLNKRGQLLKDNFADITIIAKEKSVVNQENFESKAKWTPFNGFESLVKVKYVFVNGQLTKEDDHVLSKANSGEILKRPLEIPKELLEEYKS